MSPPLLLDVQVFLLTYYILLKNVKKATLAMGYLSTKD